MIRHSIDQKISQRVCPFNSCIFLQEILTLKSGAVQHSPQDKTQPEPGPWSPVISGYLDILFCYGIQFVVVF